MPDTFKPYITISRRPVRGDKWNVTLTWADYGGVEMWSRLATSTTEANARALAAEAAKNLNIEVTES